MEVACIVNVSQDALETRGAVFNAFQFFQQQADVFSAVAMDASVPGGSYPWFAVERIHFESAVVSENGHALTLKHISCFLLGIALNGVLCCRNLFVEADIGQAQHLKVRPEYGPDF